MMFEMNSYAILNSSTLPPFERALDKQFYCFDSKYCVLLLKLLCCFIEKSKAFAFVIVVDKDCEGITPIYFCKRSFRRGATAASTVGGGGGRTLPVSSPNHFIRSSETARTP